MEFLDFGEMFRGAERANDWHLVCINMYVCIGFYCGLLQRGIIKPSNRLSNVLRV